MEGKLFPEETERARAAFDSIKDNNADTISLFEAVTVLKQLGVNTDTNSLYKEVKQWDINFDKFCEVFARLKEEFDSSNLKEILAQSFIALGGKPKQEGIVNIQTLQDAFKFFQFDLDIEDFLSHGGFDINSNIVFDDYCGIFGINGSRQ